MTDYTFVPETSNTEALYDLEAIVNKNPKPDHIKAIIKAGLLHKKAACYKEMEPYLRAPGVCGSKAFDQGNAVNILLKHDFLSVNSDGGGTLSVGPLRQKMNATKANEREVWDRLVSVLRDIGMRFRHGRLVGEPAISDQSDDDGAPDVS
jgi:hypothetical protein